MKKNSYIGYTISLISGLVIIASAFLSLVMTSSAGTLSQGQSLFEYIMNFSGGYESMFSVSLVFYIIAIVLALVEIVCAVVGLILTARSKESRVFLLIERIISLVAFVCIIISFILLGIHLLSIEAEYSNFTGLGIVLGILGSLLLIEGMFLVRKPAKVAKSVEEK